MLDHTPQRFVKVAGQSLYPAHSGDKRVTISDAHKVPIVLDSGGSLGVTPFEEGFVGKIQTLGNVHETTQIRGIGVARYEVVDKFGVHGTIYATSSLLPEANVRIFGPQSYF